MKKIPEPAPDIAIILKPAEMNKIHFGGNHTPLAPEQLKAMSEGNPTKPSPSAKGTRHKPDI